MAGAGKDFRNLFECRGMSNKSGQWVAAYNPACADRSQSFNAPKQTRTQLTAGNCFYNDNLPQQSVHALKYLSCVIAKLKNFVTRN